MAGTRARGRRARRGCSGGHLDRRRPQVSFVDRATAELGPIAILVNNAGIERTAAYETQDPAEIASVIETNLLAPMLLARAVLSGDAGAGRRSLGECLVARGEGGHRLRCALFGEQGGLIQFTESLRSEYQGRGVSASVICPGFVADAGMYARRGGADGRDRAAACGNDNTGGRGTGRATQHQA